MVASRTRHSNPDKPSTCGDVPIARPAGRPRPGRPRLHTHQVGQKAFRNQAQKRALRPATYWRRRFLSLVAGFGVLSLVAWAFSGALAVGKAGSPAPPPRASSHPAVRPAGSATPPAPARPAPAAAAPGQQSARARARARQDLARARQDLARARQHPARATAGPGGHAAKLPKAARRACRPADVVLSLFVSQDRYGPGQLPAFTVDVVSTSPRTCTFNLGPRFLAVVITGGGARIWSSADCVAGAGSNLTELVKGVPAVVPVSWGRETSAPGCFAPAARVHTGTYHAAATDGRLASRKEAVRIS